VIIAQKHWVGLAQMTTCCRLLTQVISVLHYFKTEFTNCQSLANSPCFQQKAAVSFSSRPFFGFVFDTPGLYGTSRLQSPVFSAQQLQLRPSVPAMMAERRATAQLKATHAACLRNRLSAISAIAPMPRC
jgi:hypothetical protein